MGRFDPIREAFTEQHDAAMDIVYIDGFTGRTVIGIDKNELHEAQPVRMSLMIGVPSIRACTTDHIDDTINYAAVRDAIHALLASHRLQLLEALAERIAQMVIADFGAHWVKISLAKPAKFDDVDAVGVVIERRRSWSDTTGLGWIGRGYVPQ
jgi:dihydroneopterin aldolase